MFQILNFLSLPASAYVALGVAQTPITGVLTETPGALTRQDAPPGVKEQRYELGGQATILPQTMFPFRSPYAGTNTLRSYLGTRTTESMTLYLGAKALPNVELYVDPEWIMGDGLGATSGVAAFPNVEVVRIGVRPIPYLARAFVRGIVPTGRGTTDVEADENQLAGERAEDALVFTVGKLAATDLFDKNSYANSGRTQFMNWALVNNEAYDYDADVRGYTVGAAVEWVHTVWTLRAGLFEMPTAANGPQLATNLKDDQGDQVEFEWHPTKVSALRLLGYRNVAHMGSYANALAEAEQTDTTPNITSVETNGAIKYGFGLNYEQALSDDGDTGLFSRIGWNDGATETFAYTECDSTVSAGLQISGKRWHSPKDRWAIAVCDGGLSPEHREYLAAGGLGFQVGDGKLNYGQEMLLETYYTRQFTQLIQGSLDFQLIQNPGYNQDRGPIPIASARLHFEF
jgi:high affinity Mn2+ porin